MILATHYVLLNYYLDIQAAWTVFGFLFAYSATFNYGDKKSKAEKYFDALPHPNRWTYLGLISAIIFPAFPVGFLLFFSMISLILMGSDAIKILFSYLNKPIVQKKDAPVEERLN